MDSSTTTTGTGNNTDSNGFNLEKGNNDATSSSTNSICSECDSKCDSECDSECDSSSFVDKKPHLGPYRLGKTLGLSEFGKTKLGIHSETGQKVTIRMFKKKMRGSNFAIVEREIQILKSLRHPHIVKVIDVIETDTCINIILEYASGGELFEYVVHNGRLEEEKARDIFAQLISSVNYMHMKGIVHRHLKLENLFFLDAQLTHVIVSYFDSANRFNNEDLLSTVCGAPPYAAPDMFHSQVGYKGPATDVWSCGVILYCMVCGYLPFDDDPENPNSASIGQLYRYVLSKYTLSFPGSISDDAQDLIRKMLQYDPTKRCSVEAIIDHPWLLAYRSTLVNKSTEQLEQQALDFEIKIGR